MRRNTTSPRYDVAVLDWGIGGLSVYKELVAQMPRLSILYCSDSGHTPYGKLPAVRLRQRLSQLILFFEQQGISHVVVACNAASTALPALQRHFSKRGVSLIGVIEPGVELIRSSSAQRIGIIGGGRTIRSQAFHKPFRMHRSKRVVGRVAQPLSALIEAGELRTPKMTRTLTKILKPLQTCDGLLLACTHYPAVADQIQKILPKCTLLDPARATASVVKATWRLKSKQNQTTTFLTTGDADQMRRAAKTAFGLRLGKISKLSV